MGSGKSRLFNAVTVVHVVSGVGLLLLLIRFGLPGVGLAISISALLMGVTAILRARRVVGASVREILGCLITPVVASVIALLAIGSIEYFVVHSDRRGLAVGAGLLVGESVLFVIIYLATMRLIAPRMLVSLSSEVRSALLKSRRTAV